MLNREDQVPPRFYYNAPMFRRESPNKGRYRQFGQFGIELFRLGAPVGDVEAIGLADTFLKRLKLPQPITLRLNSLGSRGSREKYARALLDFYEPYRSQLSAVAQDRLTRGAPLRILDSKEKEDVEISKNAPLLKDYLLHADQAMFEKVQSGLDFCHIEYNVDPALVRGLDYYTGTVFEFEAKSALLGANNSILAGGRYDDLPARLGPFSKWLPQEKAIG